VTTLYYEGCTIDEVRAYKELEGEVFDFGEGKMKMEWWYGSEDAYYEMCLPEKSGYDVYNCEYSYHKPKQKQKYKKRLNQYEKKGIDKIKLDQLSNTVWWAVQDNGEYKNRNYLSNKRKVAKKTTNKKIRQYKGKINNGGSYKKIYDYWWSVL